MYAIIQTGGKQYKVQEGDQIDVELLDAESGKVEFKDVLFIDNAGTFSIGAPFVQGKVVHGEIVSEVKGPKEIVYKYKKRKGVRTKKGHRQHYSRVRITKIA